MDEDENSDQDSEPTMMAFEEDRPQTGRVDDGDPEERHSDGGAEDPDAVDADQVREHPER